MTDQSAGPLTGITVIDLSHVYNGPYATFLMAMAGATVIKIEPFQGEHLRSRGDMGGAALLHDENMHARGSLQWVDHPTLGRVVLPHSPLVFEGTPRRPIEAS